MCPQMTEKAGLGVRQNVSSKVMAWIAVSLYVGSCFKSSVKQAQTLGNYSQCQSYKAEVLLGKVKAGDYRDDKRKKDMQ